MEIFAIYKKNLFNIKSNKKSDNIVSAADSTANSTSVNCLDHHAVDHIYNNDYTNVKNQNIKNFTGAIYNSTIDTTNAIDTNNIVLLNTKFNYKILFIAPLWLIYNKFWIHTIILLIILLLIYIFESKNMLPAKATFYFYILACFFIANNAVYFSERNLTKSGYVLNDIILASDKISAIKLFFGVK